MTRFFLLIVLISASAQAQYEFNRTADDIGWLPASFHKDRRDVLRDLLPDNSIVFVFTSEHKIMSNDIKFPYHPDPNFYYLSGLREPNACLVITKNMVRIDSIKTNELIYVQARKESDEVWDGHRLGVKGVKSSLEFDFVRQSQTFADIQIELEHFDHVYILAPEETPDDDPMNRGDLSSMIKHLKLIAQRDEVELNVYGVKETLAKMRQFKTEEELALIRKACYITCDSHNELMRAMSVGMTEFQAQSIVEFCFGVLGAEKRAFPSICGSGENACVLHYSNNRKRAEDNELMLVDIGAEYHGYAADVTRTFPVNGKFTPDQKTLYNLVLSAQRKAIAMCLSGKKFWDAHNTAVRELASGMIRLGIIKERREVYQYYMHGTSHYMGMDVHDCGLYGALEPGQIVTVEPGIYIPKGSDCDKRWWGIGIRIEDDILITQTGQEVLTAGSPVTISEIEALMQQESRYFKSSGF